jgi:nucleotide-binding universal stress UspA family protein
MKTILVPVDLSAATTRICDAARDLAKLIHARLVLVHVVLPQPILPADLYAFDAAAVAAAAEAEEKRATRRLAALARRYAGKKLPVLTRQSVGQPAWGILNQAAATKADYIVIGSHGHGAAYDLLIGSVAHGVLRRARCPVLLIPVKRR